MLVFFTNESFMEYQVRYFVWLPLFLVIDRFRGFYMGSLHKNIELMLELLKALGPTLFLLYINDLHDEIICNIATYAVDTTLYSQCNQAFDL